MTHNGGKNNMKLDAQNRGYRISSDGHAMVVAESARTGYSINKTVELMLSEAYIARKKAELERGNLT